MRLTTSFAAIATVISTVNASPTGSTSTCRKLRSVVAKFDKIKVQPGLPIIGSLVTHPPTPFLGLLYDGFGVENTNFQLIGDFQPKSSPNDAFYSILTGITQFTSPRIMTQPNQYIDLHSLYYSCSLDLDPVREPLDCSILMSAVDYSGNSVSTTLGYNKDGADMQMISFGTNFDRIKQITFDTTAADVGDGGAILSTQLDNISYTIYQCS